METKEYLTLYRETKRRESLRMKEAEAELEKIEEIRSSTHGTTELHMQREFARLTNAALKLKEKNPEQEQICDDILQLIKMLPPSKNEILYERYIKGSYWEQIADKTYYSLGYVQRLHREALEELQSVIDNRRAKTSKQSICTPIGAKRKI